MIELEEKYIDDNILEPYQWVQATLDRFVAINYDAALDAVRLHAKELDAGHIRQQIVDIIRNNPPLKTVPTYFRDGRANYIWYSDFYDDAGKEVFGKQYRKFEAPTVAITPASYAIELTKIDLPYFKALVDLISLIKLEREAERIERKKVAITSVVESAEDVKPMQEPEPEPEPPLPTEKPAAKQSYEPKLTTEQYALLEKCVERIKLFRRPATKAQLKKLFTGKLAEPLQVMNQLPLVYLLDLLRDAKLIKKAWMTTAVDNRDFISFRTEGQERRYGSGPHYLTMEQLTSRRRDSKHNYITGGEDIEDTIESIRASMAK